MNRKFLLLITMILFGFGVAYSQTDWRDTVNVKGLTHEDMVRIFGDLFKPGKVFKTAGDSREIKDVVINGNKITTVVYNYGSICKPNTLSQIADLVWQGLGYGFEFGPLAAAQVTVTDSTGNIDSLEIVDDSFVLPGQGSYSPDGTMKWGWLPKPGYSDPNQSSIATLNAPDDNGDGKPDSWPERWYNAGAGKYLWPAFLGDQATSPDEEVYYVMDDYTNEEFPYYPFDNDPTKRGLGLDAEVRILQFNNPLAEDIMFLVYQITNSSDKNLPIVYFGMQGDPHVGGYTDYNDDRAYYIPSSGELAVDYPQRARNMVYAYDQDGKGIGGRKTGYFGWKFLESPTNSTNGIDDDQDGLLDESPYNSFGTYLDEAHKYDNIDNLELFRAVYGEPVPRWSGDEDGDWDPTKHDVGIDGIGPESPNYPGPDFGEGDGKPSQGWYQDVNGDFKYEVGEPISADKLPGYLWAGSEPNFGMRDVSESDQLGLTSFHAAAYTNSLPNVPKNTSLMWEWLSSGKIDPNQELLQNPGDNIFNFGTGPVALERKETQRFSMSILFGDNLEDLVLNAETAQRVLESDYRFSKPPEKPIVTAVPGKGKVTLYWDNGAEKSFDPFTRSRDFEGYKIYRSRDYTFSDVYTITDGNGVPFLGQALFDPNTGKRAQFDKIDSLSGYHPVEYLGRAVKYYLGDNSGLVHEYVDSTVNDGVTYYYAVVAYDAGSIQFDIPPSETQAVINRDPITGELKFDVNTVQVTPGKIASGIQDAEAGNDGQPVQVKGNSTGEIKIKVLNDLAVQNKTYKLTFTDDSTYQIIDSTGIKETFVSKDTVFVSLGNENIQEASFKLYDSGNNLVDPSKYFLNPEAGRIRGIGSGLPAGEEYTAEYRYFPIVGSKLIEGQDGNDAFEGVRVYVKNDELGIDFDKSKFINNPQVNLADTVLFPPSVGNPRVKIRADWEFRFTGFDTTDTNDWANPGDTVMTNLGGVKVVCPWKLVNITVDEPANYLIFVPTGTKNLSRWNFNESIILRPQGATDITTSYQVFFSLPKDSTAEAIYPNDGDIFLLKTTKPFQAGDEYVFSTKEAEFKTAAASGNLDDIYVVPNPYVAYSISENPGLTTTQRGSRDIQFRNLPPKCTIRIYTIMGELVQTIEKDDNSSMASWDLLSYEGQRIAYGVYLYHIDAPGVGEKIGRFAVIK